MLVVVLLRVLLRNVHPSRGAMIHVRERIAVGPTPRNGLQAGGHPSVIAKLNPGGYLLLASR